MSYLERISLHDITTIQTRAKVTSRAKFVQNYRRKALRNPSLDVYRNHESYGILEKKYMCCMYIYLDLESNSFLCALSCINKIWTKHLQPIRFEQNGTQKKENSRYPVNTLLSRGSSIAWGFSRLLVCKKNCKISGGLELQGSSGGLWANYHIEDHPC